ncbi:MAG: hypothetical protein K2M12_10815 [Muribaculaceae bacterium]|nr:hypothetical protein [Muribaculaceae bacterium]
MNKKLIYLAAAALGCAAFTACDEDFTYPPIVEPESQWAGQQNTTVEEVKADYWQDNNNYSQAVGLSDNGSEIILRARVISSDKTGNIYNTIYVQAENADGTPGQAMAIAARTKDSSTKLAAQYPFGSLVYVNLSGVYVGRYAGLFQVGEASGTEIGFMTNATLVEHMEVSSMAHPELVDTLTVDIPTLAAAKGNNEGLQNYMGRLIRVDGVTFRNAGQPWAATQTENRYVVDAEGKSLNVRCNNRSDWHEDIIPSGSGSVVGILSYFNNDWQVLMNDVDGAIGFIPGEPVTPPDAGTPEGEGTLDSPYNVAKALEVTNALGADVTTDTEYYVKGKIVAIDEIDTGNYGNATYSIADTEGGVTFKIFRGYWLDGAKFTKADQLEVGADVIVLGKLVNFKGNTPEMAQGNKVYSYNGETGGTTPPPGPGADPAGEGTLDSPYNVAKALEVARALAADSPTATDVYIKGKISAISEISVDFGNATYDIVDADGGEAIKVFRGYWLNGDKFTKADQLAVGAEVIVLGKLVNFKGNTPEVAQGNKVYSYNGETVAPDDPTPDNPTPDDPTPDDPTPDVPVGDAITISAGNFPHENGDATGNVNGSLTQDGYTLTADKSGGNNAPAINVYNGVGTLRLYADNKLTIKGANMGKIVFTLNTSTGSKRYTTFAPSTGSINPAQKAGDASITWLGDSGEVTFTVGHDATLGSDGSGARGQVHISSIEIYPVK